MCHAVFPTEMDSNNTSIRRKPRRSCSAFTMPEMMVAMGVTGLLVMGVCGFSMYSSRSFLAMSNYSELDTANRQAMDTLTTDVRQANYVYSATTNQIVLNSPDPSDRTRNGYVTYSYNPSSRRLSRVENFPSGMHTKVLLTGCDALQFTLGQRNCTTNGVPFKGLPLTTPGVIQKTGKVIDVSWCCSRTILGRKVNTESVQTARVVIRKQRN